MRRQRLAVLVAATLALGLGACGGRHEPRGTLSEGWLTRNRDAKGPVEVPTYAWPEDQTIPLQLPGTNLVINVHNTYFQEEIQEEERRVFQVASYGSTDYYVDFDHYLIPKTEAESLEGLTQTLIERARDGVADTHVEEGIEYYTYLSEIAFDGLVYDTITLVTEDEDAYVRVVFWLEGDEDEAMAYARQMIASLRWVTDVTEAIPELPMGVEGEGEPNAETDAGTEGETGIEDGTEAGVETMADVGVDAAGDAAPDAMVTSDAGIDAGYDTGSEA